MIKKPWFTCTFIIKIVYESTRLTFANLAHVFTGLIRYWFICFVHLVSTNLANGTMQSLHKVYPLENL
jgi:hypothetical protein